MDYVLGLFLFIVAAVLAIKILSNMSLTSTFDTVRDDGNALSQQLMSEGIPSNWTGSTLIELGLLTQGKLNITKWQAFAAMNYSATKLYFDIRSNYLVLITLANTTGQNMSVITPCSAGMNLSVGSACTTIPVFIDSQNVVRVNRLVGFNGSLLALTVYTWG